MGGRLARCKTTPSMRQYGRRLSSWHSIKFTCWRRTYQPALLPARMINFVLIDNSHCRLRSYMSVHYSKPLGFVGRNICYGVKWQDTWFGAVVGGSAVSHLKGRDEFFGINKDNKSVLLQRIINNTFCHLERIDGRYPCRNFTSRVLAAWREQVAVDWEIKYGEPPFGFESLIELPRTGEMYLRDGWKEVGITKGFTCKRTSGEGTDSWSGARIWNTTELRPKRVMCHSMHVCRRNLRSLVLEQQSFEFA